jgi:ribosomal protein L23
VRTAIVRPKIKRLGKHKAGKTARYKKAFIKLKPGYTVP